MTSSLQLQRAIILAAGRGSRMLASTEDRPKCLVALGGRPLIEWQLAALNTAGISEIGVVCGYRGRQLEDRGTRRFHNPRWQETNMVQSLVYAGEWLEAAPCLVSYADIIYNADTVRKLAQSEGDLAITFDVHWRELWEWRFEDPLEDAETFRRNGEGRLKEIGNRARSLDEIEGQYMGLLRFTPDGWQQVLDFLNTLPPEKQDKLDMTSLLRGLLERGVAIDTVPIEDRWLEVDSEDDLKLYEARFNGSDPGWFKRS